LASLTGTLVEDMQQIVEALGLVESVEELVITLMTIFNGCPTSSLGKLAGELMNPYMFLFKIVDGKTQIAAFTPTIENGCVLLIPIRHDEEETEVVKIDGFLPLICNSALVDILNSTAFKFLLQVVMTGNITSLPHADIYLAMLMNAFMQMWRLPKSEYSIGKMTLILDIIHMLSPQWWKTFLWKLINKPSECIDEKCSSLIQIIVGIEYLKKFKPEALIDMKTLGDSTLLNFFLRTTKGDVSVKNYQVEFKELTDDLIQYTPSTLKQYIKKNHTIVSSDLLYEEIMKFYNVASAGDIRLEEILEYFMRWGIGNSLKGCYKAAISAKAEDFKSTRDREKIQTAIDNEIKRLTSLMVEQYVHYHEGVPTIFTPKTLGEISKSMPNDYDWKIEVGEAWDGVGMIGFPVAVSRKPIGGKYRSQVVCAYENCPCFLKTRPVGHIKYYESTNATVKQHSFISQHKRMLSFLKMGITDTVEIYYSLKCEAEKKHERIPSDYQDSLQLIEKIVKQMRELGV